MISFLVVGGYIGGIHLLRFKQLAVDSGGEIPVLRVYIALVGVAVRDLIAVDCHHLGFTGLSLCRSLALCG